MPRAVLANGCFDPLHAGHVLHLQAAKRMGDVLWVAVTDDKHVAMEKGPGRPARPAHERCAVLRELKCVDFVFICPSTLEALQFVEPAVFVKGIDYYGVGRIDIHIAAYCASHNVEIRFTETPKLSATTILNELRQGKRL